MNAGELIEYSTVEQMAETYREATAKIRKAIAEIGEQCGHLRASFADERSRFAISLEHNGRRQHSSECNIEGADKIIARMKLEAWAIIIEKLNIRRLMSSKRIDELNRALQGEAPNYDQPVQEFPEITPENIQRVAQGYLMSANEFLEEAIAEEYDFWRPRNSRQADSYKRNCDWKLNPKIIEGYMVEPGWSGSGGKFRCSYHRGQHITALDSIFHLLGGLGPVKEYKGPLATAIETSPDGRGETEFFRFKCYKNGNLHLEFKRLDLLALFNQIAGKSDRLGQERRSA